MVPHRVTQVSVMDALEKLTYSALETFVPEAEREVFMEASVEIMIHLANLPISEGQRMALCIALAFGIAENSRCQHRHTSN